MTDKQMPSKGSSVETDDPIVTQVRAERDAIAASVNYDLDALFERVKKHEELERSNGRAILPNTGAAPNAAA
jgi:hypothetical protein